MGRCNPKTNTCTRTPWWRESMGINWYGQGGGVQALYVNDGGSGTGDGSSEANAMSADDFLTHVVTDGTEVRIIEDLEV